MAVNTEYQQPDRFPGTRTTLYLRGPVGRLECIANTPEPGVARPGTIVICHPHPQFGGSMQNKVVTTLERSMRELGFHTLRFNFRGTGNSEGHYDEGRGETDDLLAVAAWARRTRPEDELWLGGFSFGSYIALRAARQLKPGLMISIAPPVKRYKFSALPHPHCPWLVIQGDEDDVVNYQDVVAWVGETDPEPELVVMAGSGHFFHRRLIELRNLLKNGLGPHLPPIQSG